MLDGFAAVVELICLAVASWCVVCLIGCVDVVLLLRCFLFSCVNCYVVADLFAAGLLWVVDIFVVLILFGLCW